MYKVKFSSREEAYEYMVDHLRTARSKNTILTNYAKACSKLPPTPIVKTALTQPSPRPTMSVFDFKEGSVPANVIRLDGSTLYI